MSIPYGTLRDIANELKNIREILEKQLTDTPQTDCEGCEHWKYIAHEWQCETEKCQKDSVDGLRLKGAENEVD